MWINLRYSDGYILIIIWYLIFNKVQGTHRITHWRISHRNGHYCQLLGKSDKFIEYYSTSSFILIRLNLPTCWFSLILPPCWYSVTLPSCQYKKYKSKKYSCFRLKIYSSLQDKFSSAANIWDHIFVKWI